LFQEMSLWRISIQIKKAAQRCRRKRLVERFFAGWLTTKNKSIQTFTLSYQIFSMSRPQLAWIVALYRVGEEN